MKPISLISVLVLLLAVPSHGQDLNRDSVPTVNVYKDAEEFPIYPGGTDGLKRFVEKNFIFPAEAWGDTTYTNVGKLRFIVRRDGVACGLDKEGMHPAVYKEWQRLFSIMPLWEPGRIKGFPVDVECRISISPGTVSPKLPFHIDRKMNNLKKRIDVNKKYNKGMDKEEAENLVKEMDEIVFYNPEVIEIFVPLARLSVSLNERDKAVEVVQNGLEGLNKWLKDKERSPSLVLYFNAKDYMSAVLAYALVCDAAEGEGKKAYEYAQYVIDGRILLKDIETKKSGNDANETYRRLMIEKRNIAVLGSGTRGNTLNGPERENIYRYGWISGKTMDDIDAAMKEGKIDNPRLRQINTQLKEMEEERRKNPPMGKDSLYLYGLRAMVIDLAEGQDAVNRYVNDMCQREDVGKELKSYLSKLSEKRRKYASVLEDREAVVRSLASYAPINEEGEDKSECKRRAKEFYERRDAMKAVYPLEWLWKQ